jgi:SAM-dependent methyltransferase
MKTYTELHGGLGRAINFRPTRYRVTELLRDHPPRLSVNGQDTQLHDVAMSGISFIVPPTTTFEIGDKLQIVLSIGADKAFEGAGEVVRVEKSPGRFRIGVSLPHDFIDVPGLLDRHESIALSEALSGGADALRGAVPAEYREVVERAVLFVQHTRDVLDRNEARLRSRGLPEQRVLELAGDAARSLQPTWTSISRAAARALAPHLHDRRTTDACRRYTRLVLTSLLTDAPGIQRAVEKPLGYPGDYETMNYIYRDELEGGSAFAKVFHKFGVDEPLAAGARTRKELIKGVMREEHLRALASRGPEATFDVLGLGCGPAVEVEEYIREWKAWAGSVRWTLVDQEEAALSIAYAGAYRALTQTNCSGQVRCFYLSFQHMIQEPKLLGATSNHDLIYAAGFFDYLPQKVARKLVSDLVDRLAPDGVLLIGNAIGPNDHFWFAEHILDWPLIYRTKEDMEDLAAPVADRATGEITKDSLGVYHVLVLRRHVDR